MYFLDIWLFIQLGRVLQTGVMLISHFQILPPLLSSEVTVWHQVIGVDLSTTEDTPMLEVRDCEMADQLVMSCGADGSLSGTWVSERRLHSSPGVLCWGSGVVLRQYLHGGLFWSLLGLNGGGDTTMVTPSAVAREDLLLNSSVAARFSNRRLASSTSSFALSHPPTLPRGPAHTQRP